MDAADEEETYEQYKARMAQEEAGDQDEASE